jgi:hypothetical protein
MAMQLIVLSDRQIASIAEWQDAISAEGLSLRLPKETPLEAFGGFLAAQLGEKPAGFECGHRDADAVMSECPGIQFGHDWRYAFSFRWPGLNALRETIAVFIASAAYGKATAGIVLDREAATLFSPQRAAEIAREFEADLPLAEEVFRLAAEAAKTDLAGGRGDEPIYTVTARWLNPPE